MSKAKRESVDLFQRTISNAYKDWNSLLKGLDNPRARPEDVIRVIEEGISSELLIVEPLERDDKLEQELKKKYPLLKDTALVVVKIPNHFRPFSSFVQLLVALSAAYRFQKIVRSSDTVAISGGSTLLRFARCIMYGENLEGLTFFPLDINPLASQVELDASSIVALLKVRLKCQGFAFHNDALLEDLEKTFDETMLGQEAFEVLQRAGSSKLAFVGVGNPQGRADSRVAYNEYITRPKLIAAGIVADLLFHLLDEDGNEVEVDSNFNQRVVSLTLESLKRMAINDLVVGVVHGDDKAGALRAVLKGGYLSGLVTHDSLARRVLAPKTKK